MPQFGAIGFSTPNSNASKTTPSTAVGQNQILPSPSIWGSCDAQALRDNPDGFFFDYNFKDTVTAPGLPSQNGTYTIPASSTDSALNIAYTSTGNATVFVRPMVTIAPNGASKTWFEVGLNVLQSTAQEIFVGLATSTGLSSTLLATSTTLLASTGLIGFWLHGDAPTNFDAIVQGNTAGNTAPTTVLGSTLTAGANNSDPGNPLYVPATAPGALTGSQGYIKLGVKTDKTNAYFYVNGSLVAKKQIDNTFDTADSYGAVVTVGTATANTDNVAISFLRTAAKFS